MGSPATAFTLPMMTIGDVIDVPDAGVSMVMFGFVFGNSCDSVGVCVIGCVTGLESSGIAVLVFVSVLVCSRIAINAVDVGVVVGTARSGLVFGSEFWFGCGSVSDVGVFELAAV